MSVINKMLRDLDQRQAPAALGATVSHAPQPPAWHRGIHSLPVLTTVSGAAPRSTTAWRLGLGLVLLAGVGLASWLALQRMGAHVPAAATPVAAPAVAPVPAVSPAQIEVAPPMVSVSAQGAVNGSARVSPEPVPPVPVKTVAVQMVQVSVPASAVPVPAPSGSTGNTASPIPHLTASLPVASVLPTREASNAVLAGAYAPVVTEPVAPPTAVPKASLLPTEPPSATQRQQQASADVLLQAQTLWSAGSHAAAIDWLQQSVDAAERGANADTSMVGHPALLSLVRELVRMQMAQSQFAAVWDLLVRLEPVLGNQPDLWALRGNTGQRLGRHQDSVAAYRAALQSRPDEPRWLLGCAVSLAALGQAAQAGDMAERARSVGPISREVQVYLQQMGVPLKDK